MKIEAPIAWPIELFGLRIPATISERVIPPPVWLDPPPRTDSVLVKAPGAPSDSYLLATSRKGIPGLPPQAEQYCAALYLKNSRSSQVGVRSRGLRRRSWYSLATNLT